jgi:phosphoglycolate phosphatase
VIKLLVFDLDGTLVDTLNDIGHSVNHALQRCGVQTLPLPVIKTCIGDGARVLMERSLLAAQNQGQTSLGIYSNPGPTHPGILDKLLAEFMEHYKINFMVKSRPYPGVIESLEKLSGLKKAVLTNKPTGPAMQLIEGLKLSHHFDWVLGGDNSFGPKPNPKALNHLISLAGTEPSNTVMIGDGVQDLRVARNAKTHFLGFLNGLGDPQALISEQAEAILEDMHLLPEALASFQNQSLPVSDNRKSPSGDRS